MDSNNKAPVESKAALERAVLEVLSREAGPGWQLGKEPIAPESFLVTKPGGQRLATAIHQVGTRSIEDVEARLALAILRSRDPTQHGNQPTLLIVHLPRLGPRMRTSVRAFMRAHGRGLLWMVLDDHGNVEGDLFGKLVQTEGEPPGIRAHRSGALFTDLNRWMLKVLLLRSRSPKEWGGPRGEVRHATDLAAVASVSVATAHHFVNTLREKGFADAGRGRLHLTDPSELLRLWLDQESVAPVHRTPCQMALGRFTVTALSKYQGRWALGGFAATEELGLTHATVRAPPEVHVDDSRIAMLALDLVPTNDVRDAHLVLRVPTEPESVFRGAVTANGHRRVDVLQAGLDVVGVRPRGREQAEYLVERVLHG